MSVDRKEVDRIAALARLRLDDDEADRLTDEMNRILEHADRLREASDVLEEPRSSAPLSEGMAGTRRTEADVPDELASEIDAFAPRSADGFFLVPPPRGVTADGEE